MLLKKILFHLSFIGSLITTYLFLKFSHTSHHLSNLIFYDINVLDTTSDAGKWIILRSLLFKIALFVYAHIAFIMFSRIIIDKTNPAIEEDPQTLKIANRIISNTMQQSFVFVALYAYFIFQKAGDRFNNNQLLSFASWFVVGRVLFSLGYIIGSFIGVSVMRAFGFTLNVITNVILIEFLLCQKAYLAPYFFEA